MSDEPQRRSRGWIGWALICALVLYPLSIGPVCWFAPEGTDETIQKVYAPIWWLWRNSDHAERVISWYVSLPER